MDTRTSGFLSILCRIALVFLSFLPMIEPLGLRAQSPPDESLYTNPLDPTIGFDASGDAMIRSRRCYLVTPDRGSRLDVFGGGSAWTSRRISYSSSSCTRAAGTPVPMVLPL